MNSSSVSIAPFHNCSNSSMLQYYALLTLIIGSTNIKLEWHSVERIPPPSQTADVAKSLLLKTRGNTCPPVRSTAVPHPTVSLTIPTLTLTKVIRITTVGAATNLARMIIECSEQSNYFIRYTKPCQQQPECRSAQRIKGGTEINISVIFQLLKSFQLQLQLVF